MGHIMGRKCTESSSELEHLHHPSIHVLQKRRRVVESHLRTDLYAKYKLAKQRLDSDPCSLPKGVGSVDVAKDLPNTPRPDMYTSKRQWEAAMFNWRSCMRELVAAAAAVAENPTTDLQLTDVPTAAAAAEQNSSESESPAAGSVQAAA